ncbi:glycosyltransferase [Frankia gtarii]|uniref:glycosyltransferase n=1 Tax=Frankia gtarii TaxID=2950102 RepID=UPI0021BF6C4F|nr:glycosyltransferase family 4 protein [Frankia gtarii]
MTRALGVRSTILDPDEGRRSTRPQRYSSRLSARFAAGLYRDDLIDVIHVEGGYLFHQVPAELQRHTCLVEHNIESDVLRQFAGLLGDQVLARSAHRTAQVEERAWRRAGAVAAVTPEDRAEIERRSGRPDVFLVPNGSDHLPAGAGRVLPPSAPPTALMVANFSYLPNADALQVILNSVWPKILNEIPEARLLLAGSNISAQQRESASRVPAVEVIGFVEDVATVFDQADVLVCPLRAGGGIKVKVLESIRRGCPVVTTTIGAQGITGRVRSALHIVDDLADLATATAILLRARDERALRREQMLLVSADMLSWKDASSMLGKVWEMVATEHEQSRNEIADLAGRDRSRP